MSELTHCNFFLVKCIVKPSFIMIFLFDHRMTIDASEFKKKKRRDHLSSKTPCPSPPYFLIQHITSKAANIFIAAENIKIAAQIDPNSHRFAVCRERV